MTDSSPPNSVEWWREKRVQFPDGTINFVTDAEWWAYYDRAAREAGWSAENQALLAALGILIGCEWVWTRDDAIVSINQTIPICFPTVVNPYEARGPIALTSGCGAGRHTGPRLMPSGSCQWTKHNVAIVV